MNNAKLKEKLKALPTTPGVYFFKDKKGSIFYIGKAKNLRSRVRSYFSGSDQRAFVSRLDEWLEDIEVVLTHTEMEALLLENDLIKEHKPRFNVLLTDDKNFLCLQLNRAHPYPRLEVIRNPKKSKKKLFGPYPSASALRETLRLINKHFQLRTCSDQVLKTRKRPCLQYQIKRCPAPCIFDLEKEGKHNYTQNVQNVLDFLEGKEDELIAQLRKRMQNHSALFQYETAALIRDQIKAIEHLMEKQHVIRSDFKDRDILGTYREGNEVELHVIRMRHGRLIDAKRFSLSDVKLSKSMLLSDFLCRYYAAPHDNTLPQEILLPEKIEWSQELEKLLSRDRGSKTHFLVPQRGAKKNVLDLAQKNAKQAFVDKQRKNTAALEAMKSLHRSLQLKKLPERIECYDISHFQGSFIVASQVLFEQGQAQKKGYRHYKIRSIQEQDDFQSMKEVLGRRAKRALEDGDLPDLIVVDGGKGQLNAAQKALQEYGLEDQVDLISLAKSRLKTSHISSNEKMRSQERVFLLGKEHPITLQQDSPELFLLMQARDEAHRFAIRFHRKTRSSHTLSSSLETISGIGPKRRKILLKTFGSLKGIQKANIPELSACVGESLAKKIALHWKKAKKDPQ